MSTSSRFTAGQANQDNTLRTRTQDIQSPAANQATLAITTVAEETTVFESINAAQTINAAAPLTSGAPFLNDTLEIQVNNTAGVASVVTFGTNFQSAGTASVAAAKWGTVKFRFNGTAWVETARALTV